MTNKKVILIGNKPIKRQKIEKKDVKIPTTFTKIEDTQKKRSYIKNNNSKKVKKRKSEKTQPKIHENQLMLKMLNREESNMFLVKKEVLPKMLLQTAKVKEALIRGEALTIQDALEEYEISYSTYYKYKDSIFPFYEANVKKTYSLLIEVEHNETVLSKIITFITKHHGNIIQINQGFPLNGIAKINLSVETNLLDMNLEILILRLRDIEGVREIEIMGRD